MAILTTITPPSTYDLIIALETTLGTAETTNTDFVRLPLDAAADISWGTGLLTDDTPRTGQQFARPDQRFANPSGSTHELAFSWPVNQIEGLDLLLASVTETAASPYSQLGNALQPVYQNGADTGIKLTAIINNGDGTEDRTMPGCVVTSLTLAASNDAAGARMVATGTLMTGFDVTIGASAVTASGTETAYQPGISDLTTITFDGNDVLIDSYSITFTYPMKPLGSTTGTLEPQLYSRAGVPEVTGEISLKLDANSSAAITTLENGGTIAIVFTGSNFGVTIPKADTPSYAPDLTLGDEKGAFVTIGFRGTADGAEAVYTVTTA